MAILDTADSLSISDAEKLGVFGLASAVEAGHEYVLLRDEEPVAVVVSMERIEQIQQLEEDLLDVSLAAARMLAASACRHSLDEVLAQFGYTREQLRREDDEPKA